MERYLSTCQEKTVFDKRDLRGGGIVYWIESNNLQLQFTIFNKLWHPIFDKKNLRGAVIVYWTEPNILQSQFTIFNKLWLPVSPIDVRIELRLKIHQNHITF